MDINLNLHSGFAECLKKLMKKYGEKFSIINGFSNSNLNFTDFIDNFIKSTSVADTTIDANANSTTLDIRTLLSDMVKPHTKLLSYNKIFKQYKISKYGTKKQKILFSLLKYKIFLLYYMIKKLVIK